MRSLTIILSLLAISNAWTQSDTSSNSLGKVYKTSNPTVKYQYLQEKQIHDYSNNWDFDKDGKLDQIYFVGTGGAHLYYYLRIILSSDDIVRDFPFIQTDFPILPRDEELTKIAYKPDGAQTYFAVFEDNNNPAFLSSLTNHHLQSKKKF
jgi:hypothetical protein